MVNSGALVRRPERHPRRPGYRSGAYSLHLPQVDIKGLYKLRNPVTVNCLNTDGRREPGRFLSNHEAHERIP